MPVGTTLAAILANRRTGPDGKPFGPDCYVFGNSVGEKVGSIKKSWMTAVLKAHGHQPQWDKRGKNQLSAESRAAYRACDLHFHDLRREAASRLVEAGATVVEAQHLLGHSSVQQTAIYLASSLKALETAIERKEAHERRLAEARQQRQVAQQAAEIGPPVSREIQ